MARGLRHLTKRRITPAETTRILLQFQKMDDRSTAIILGAMLDHSLERLILLHLVRLTKENREKLFYGTGPLSSFSAKIRVAFAFGIIGPKSAHDLEVLNEIRNAFGHASSPITFRNRSIRGRLEGLNVGSMTAMLLTAFRNKTMQLFNNTRGRFFLSAFSYVQQLDEARKGKLPKKLQQRVRGLDH